MNPTIVIGAAVLWLAFGNLALADWEAAALKLLCKAQDKESDTMCSIYIAGVYDGFSGAQLMTQQGMASCMPSIGSGKARTIIEKYLDDHPEMGEKPAPMVSVLAHCVPAHCPGNRIRSQTSGIRSPACSMPGVLTAAYGVPTGHAHTPSSTTSRRSNPSSRLTA